MSKSMLFRLSAQCPEVKALMEDKKRLDWMLSNAYESDGAWLITCCLDVHPDGIRAAIDKWRSLPVGGLPKSPHTCTKKKQ